MPTAVTSPSSGILSSRAAAQTRDAPMQSLPQQLRLVPTLCNLCGTDDSEPIAVGEDFEYQTSPDQFLMVCCRRCGLIYLNPRPAESEFARIYPDHYHVFAFQPEQFGLIYKVRRRLEAHRLLKWCRGLPARARILDVGCGDGFHLKLLRDFGRPGWTLEGVDLDSRAVKAATTAGLTVHQGELAKLHLPEASYDLIILIMTIEHLADPLSMLREVERLLTPGGRVGIITDHADSPDFTLFGGRHWGGYHFPRHWNLYTRKTLQRLGEQAGLHTERITTDFTPVNWTYSFRNWLQDWGGPKWLVRSLSLESAPALAAFTLLDIPLAMLGQGGMLRASFRKGVA